MEIDKNAAELVLEIFREVSHTKQLLRRSPFNEMERFLNIGNNLSLLMNSCFRNIDFPSLPELLVVRNFILEVKELPVEQFRKAEAELNSHLSVLSDKLLLLKSLIESRTHESQ